MRGIFKDAGLQAKIEAEGFVRSSLLQPDEIARLRSLYERLGPSAPSGFHPTLKSSDMEYRKAVHFGVTATLARGVNELLDDYRLCVGNFAVKRTGEASNEVPIHQDWSFVDRAQFREINIFCPLTDVDASNGCLQVVPGSHRFRDEVRPNAAPNGFVYPCTGMSTAFQPYLRDQPLKAGEALFYDARTLHASRSCQLRSDRVVALAVSVPREAQLLHYFTVSPTEHEVFEVGEDFYYAKVRLLSRPEGARSLGRVEYVSGAFTREELARHLKPVGTIRHLASRIAALASRTTEWAAHRRRDRTGAHR